MPRRVRIAASLVVIAVALGLSAHGGSTAVNAGVLPDVTSRASLVAGMMCVRHCVLAEYPIPDPGSGAFSVPQTPVSCRLDVRLRQPHLQ